MNDVRLQDQTPRRVTWLRPRTVPACSSPGALRAVCINLILLFVLNIEARADQHAIAIDSLIGIKIPARSATQTGSLHGWHEKGGTILGNSDLGLGLSEYYRNGQAVFVITMTDGKLNKMILDARKIPLSVMNYKIVGNKLYFPKNADNRYSLAPYCESKRETELIVVGLAKPDRKFKDCSHWTSQIYAAWAVDASTGKLRTISAKGVTCLLDDYEYSCEDLQPRKE